MILNKKSITNYEQQLFQQELEKYRPYQNRLVQATHKQAALMRELTVAFNGLLQDKRVRAEQSKYESFQRQRGTVISKYKRAYQEFLDLEAGLQGAKTWYTEMKETVESLEKNVETFVNNRRSEGAQLLNQIEGERAANKGAQAALEQERLRGLMERMSVEPPPPSPRPIPSSRPTPTPLSFTTTPLYPKTNYAGHYQLPSSPPPTQTTAPQSYLPQQPPNQTFTYNPSSHGRIPGPASPPPTQTAFNIGPIRPGPASPPPTQTSFGQQAAARYSTYGNPTGMPPPQQQQQPQQQHQASYVPPNFVPPPPPPGPPPLGPQQTVHYAGREYYTGDPNGGRPGSAMGRGAGPGQPGQPGQDPWAGLSAWK